MNTLDDKVTGYRLGTRPEVGGGVQSVCTRYEFAKYQTQTYRSTQ